MIPMEDSLGGVSVKLSPQQLEPIIVYFEGDKVCISVGEIMCLDTLLARKLIIGGLNGYLNELVEMKLKEMKTLDKMREDMR